jgi:hypothetical protein
VVEKKASSGGNAPDAAVLEWGRNLYTYMVPARQTTPSAGSASFKVAGNHAAAIGTSVRAARMLENRSTTSSLRKSMPRSRTVVLVMIGIGRCSCPFASWTLSHPSRSSVLASQQALLRRSLQTSHRVFPTHENDPLGFTAMLD